MAKAGSLDYVVTLDAARFEGPLKAIHAGLDRVHGSFLSTGRVLAGFAAGYLTARGAASAFLEVIARSGEYTALRRQTGETISNLVVLNRAFRDSSLGSQILRPTLQFLQASLAGVNAEGQPTNKVIAQLGLNLDALRRLSPTQQLEAVAGALRGLSSQEERTLRARQLFGRQGGQILSVLADSGAIAKARENVAGYASVLDRSAERLDRIGNLIAAARDRVTEFFTGVLSKAGPDLEAFLAGFSKLDAVGAGQRSGLAEAIRLLLGYLRATAEAFAPLARFLNEHIAHVGTAAKAVLSLSVAYAGIKLASVLTSLTAKTAALVRSATATQAETAAVEANTVAHTRNAAARSAAATGPAAMLAGSTRRDLRAVGGSLVAYSTPPGAGPMPINRNFTEAQLAAANASGKLSGQLNATRASTTGLRTATAALGGVFGITTFGLAALAAGMLAYTAKLEKAALATENFGKDQFDLLGTLTQSARSVESIADKERMLAQVREQLATIPGLRAEAAGDAQKLNTVNLLQRSYESLENRLLALTNASLKLKEADAKWAADQAAALTRLIDLSGQLEEARQTLAKGREQFTFDNLSKPGQLAFVEDRQRDIIKRSGVDPRGKSIGGIADAMEERAQALRFNASQGTPAERETAAKEAMRLREDAARLLELETKRRAVNKEIGLDTKSAADATRTREDARTELAILEARADGEEKIAAELERQLKIRKEASDLEAKGFNAADAAAIATRKVDAEKKINETGDSPTPRFQFEPDRYARIGLFSTKPIAGAAESDAAKRSAASLDRIEKRLNQGITVEAKRGKPEDFQ